MSRATSHCWDQRFVCFENLKPTFAYCPCSQGVLHYMLEEHNMQTTWGFDPFKILLSLVVKISLLLLQVTSFSFIFLLTINFNTIAHFYLKQSSVSSASYLFPPPQPYTLHLPFIIPSSFHLITTRALAAFPPFVPCFFPKPISFPPINLLSFHLARWTIPTGYPGPNYWHEPSKLHPPNAHW